MRLDVVWSACEGGSYAQALALNATCCCRFANEAFSSGPHKDNPCGAVAGRWRTPSENVRFRSKEVFDPAAAPRTIQVRTGAPRDNGATGAQGAYKLSGSHVTLSGVLRG